MGEKLKRPASLSPPNTQCSAEPRVLTFVGRPHVAHYPNTDAKIRNSFEPGHNSTDKNIDLGDI